jgi:hypothetical protein
MRLSVKRFTLFASLMLVMSLFVGCKAANTPLPANAINATDARISANLEAAHAAVVNYQSNVVAGKHTPDATEKAVVNKFIASLNAADRIYCGAPAQGQPCAVGSYHALLVANPAAGEPQQLIDAMLAVTQNLSAIQTLVQEVK